MIKSHELFRQLGVNEAERQSAYRQLFRLTIGKFDLDALCEVTNKGWGLVGDRFRAEIERLSGQRSVAKPSGGSTNVKI